MWRDSLKDVAAAIRAHPQFDEASRQFLGDLVAWRIRLGVLNKVVSNLGRERIIVHLLYLHYARDLDGAGHGATFERLAALSDEREGFGARAVRTALRLAQIGGLIARVRSRDDGRLRIFEPTELLLVIMREYYAILFRLFEKLLPGFSMAARLRREHDLLPELLSRGGRAYLAIQSRSRSIADPFTDLLRLEGGRAIVSMVVDCHRNRRDLPMTQELAQRAHVSSSQARVILKSAQSHGLIRLGKRGGVLDASELAEEYLQYYCRYLAFFARYVLDLEDRLLHVDAADGQRTRLEMDES